MTDTAEALQFRQVGRLRLVRSQTRYERAFKRTFDVVLGFVLALIALPIVITVAVVVRVGLGKGVFYAQERAGRHGEPFTIWKFRTMRPDRRRQNAFPVENDRRQGHKSDADPRHTMVGRLLRKLSLDELPQLWNVLRGEMSLVGPRPEILDIARARGYLEHVRHDVRPGMTGPFQVSDLRVSGDLRDGLHLDEHYVHNVSFVRDLRYLLRTVWVMIGPGPSGA